MSQTTDAETETDAQTTEEPDAETEAETSRDIGFEFIIERGTLEAFLDSVRAVYDECTLHINDDGLSTKVIDAQSAFSANVRLDPAAFEHFEATRTRVGMDLEKLAGAIEFAGKNDVVHVKYDEETRRINLQIDGTELNLAGIDPDAIRNEPEFPDLDLPVDATLPASTFKRVLKMAKFVDETGVVTFTHDADKDELSFTMSGYDDTGEHSMDTNELPEFNAAGSAESMFSVPYLDSFVPPMPSGAEVRMELGVEHPLVIEYERADGYCEVLYMVGPRIQSR